MDASDHDLLVRIDERTQTFAAAMPTFVLRTEFKPVRTIAFGLVAILATGVMYLVVSLLAGKSPNI